MPILAGIAQTDRLTVLYDVRNDENFRVISQEKLLEHMDLQNAKTSTEVNLLLRGDVLIAEYDNVVVQMCLMNASEVRVIEWPG